jgi:hypothetical protein
MGMNRKTVIVSFILLVAIAFAVFLVYNNSLTMRGFRASPETSPSNGYVYFENKTGQSAIQIYRCFTEFDPNKIPDTKLLSTVDAYGTTWYFVQRGKYYSLISFIKTNKCANGKSGFINVTGNSSDLNYYLKLARLSISYYNKIWK